MAASRCRTCKRAIRWATSAAHEKPMPLDEHPDRGNVLIENLTGKAHVFKDNAAALEALDADTYRWRPTTYISHHAAGQCPKGPEWQGKKRGDPDEPGPAQESLPI